MDLIVVDDFLKNADQIREQALVADYEDWLAPDGQVYKRIHRGEIEGLQPTIEAWMGKPVNMLGMGFRLNYENELPNSLVHTDFGWGTHALVLYLSTGKSGTAFFTHRPTGTDRVRLDSPYLPAVTKDWNNREAWRLDREVPMQFNRAAIYRSELYHSRYPFHAFGSTPVDGRLIAVAFFTPKDEIMIRKAVENDLLKIMEMSQKFYAQTHYAKMVETNEAAVAALAIYLMEQGTLFVGEVGGEVKGMFGCVCTPFIFNPVLLGAHELVLYVDEDARSSGLGPKMMLHAEKELKRAGVNFIQMADLPENTSGAGEMYQRLGYTTSEFSYTKVI